MRWFAGSALALAFLAAPAWAEDAAATEPLALRYDAPAACPDAAAFFGQLRARTARVRAPNDGEAARALVVRVAPAGRGFIGHLHFEDAGTTTSPRVVEASSCAEVIEALNLSAALAVDPSASTAPATALPAPATSPAPEAAPAPPAPAPPPPAEPIPAPAPAPAPRAERTAPAPPLDARFGAGVAVEAAALSGLVPSGRVFLEGTLREHASLVAPALRVFVARSLDVDQAPAIGTASMTWTTGGLAACPIRVHVAPTLALRPCAEIAAGTIAANVSGVDAAKNRTRAWVAVDVHGRLAWELARFLALEVEAGATAPLVRETFFFLPNTDVYMAPTIGFFGRMGVSVRFP